MRGKDKPFLRDPPLPRGLVIAHRSGDRTRRYQLSLNELPLRDSAGISPDFAVFYAASYR